MDLNLDLKLNVNTLRPLAGEGRKLFVETYGCQMNVGDTEIVVALMQQEGYVYTERIAEADVILINTCSIRDNAEQRIWGRLAEMKRYRRERPGLVIGIIGCMAERLKEQLVEGPNAVDVVAGPDAYRDLPRLVREAEAGGKGVNVLLSTEETYAEIAPVRLDRNGVSAFVGIMRGCNNFCSYCVVPYTRGANGAVMRRPSSPRPGASSRMATARSRCSVRTSIPIGRAMSISRSSCGAWRRSRRCCVCVSPPPIPRT